MDEIDSAYARVFRSRKSATPVVDWNGASIKSISDIPLSSFSPCSMLIVDDRQRVEVVGMFKIALSKCFIGRDQFKNRTDRRRLTKSVRTSEAVSIRGIKSRSKVFFERTAQS